MTPTTSVFYAHIFMFIFWSCLLSKLCISKHLTVQIVHPAPGCNSSSELILDYNDAQLRLFHKVVVPKDERRVDDEKPWYGAEMAEMMACIDLKMNIGHYTPLGLRRD